MKHVWIMDVLSDLKEYARRNDMPLLVAQLEEIRLAAALELSNRPAGEGGALGDGGSGAGDHRRAASGGHNT